MHIEVFTHTRSQRQFLHPLCSWSGYRPAQTASNGRICMIKCARCRRKQLRLFPVSLLMEARAGLAAVVENCCEHRMVYACRGWDRRTNTTEPVALSRPGVLTGTTMLPYMPFVSDYWPYIITGIICYVGAKFMYHSAVYWNSKPGEAQNNKYQSYESPDEGTLISH